MKAKLRWTCDDPQRGIDSTPYTVYGPSQNDVKRKRPAATAYRSAPRLLRSIMEDTCRFTAVFRVIESGGVSEERSVVSNPDHDTTWRNHQDRCRRRE